MRLARMFGASDAVALSAALLFAGTWLGFKSMLLVRPDPLLILASTAGLCAIVARLQGGRWANMGLSVSIAVGFLAKGIAILPLVLLAFNARGCFVSHALNGLHHLGGPFLPRHFLFWFGLRRRKASCLGIPCVF